MKKIKIPDFRTFNPIKQGAFILLFITLISISCFIIGQKSMLVWTLIMLPLILFCLYNPILGLFQQKMLQYYFQSVLTFLILLMYAYISGSFISEFPYLPSRELHILTFAVIVFYLVLHISCLLFRGILFILNDIDD